MYPVFPGLGLIVLTLDYVIFNKSCKYLLNIKGLLLTWVNRTSFFFFIFNYYSQNKEFSFQLFEVTLKKTFNNLKRMNIIM